MAQVGDFIIFFMISFMISFIVQKIVIKISHQHTLFIDDNSDKPQKFHNTPTPRAGGIGIIIALGLIFVAPINYIIFFPIFLAFLSGIFEDFNGSLSPIQRLFLQLFSAISAIVLLNAVVTYLGLGINLPYLFGIVFSAFAIVGAINALNIIDGFNGLAGFVSLNILISFSIVAYLVGDKNILMLNIIAIGAIIGFLFNNYPNAKIFLGDGGAYMLGFITALSGIYLASNYTNVSPWFVLNILIYPVFEVIFSIYRKRSRDMSPLEPDRVHFHMLINKRVTRNNPQTTKYILLFVLPFIYIPLLFFHSSIYNIISILIFISLYIFIYKKMIRFEVFKKNV